MTFWSGNFNVTIGPFRWCLKCTIFNRTTNISILFFDLMLSPYLRFSGKTSWDHFMISALEAHVQHYWPFLLHRNLGHHGSGHKLAYLLFLFCFIFSFYCFYFFIMMKVFLLSYCGIKNQWLRFHNVHRWHICYS